MLKVAPPPPEERLGADAVVAQWEAFGDRAVVFISQTLQFKVQKDLQIYFPKELESVFIELFFPNKLSFVVGTICKYFSQ